jgi:hypothetical protein
MKQCPRCNRIYTDDTLSYCLDDGTFLTRRRDSEATLVSQFPPLQNPQVFNTPPAPASPPAPRQGFPLWTVGAFALVALALGLGIGGLIFQSYGPPSTDAPLAAPTPRRMALATASPTPTPTPAAVSATPLATPLATSSPAIVQSTPEQNCILYNDRADKSMVRVRSNCDTRDCDNDASTIAGEYPDSTPVRVIKGSAVRGVNFTWVKVVIVSSGQSVWVATSKIKCG